MSIGGCQPGIYWGQAKLTNVLLRLNLQVGSRRLERARGAGEAVHDRSRDNTSLWFYAMSFIGTVSRSSELHLALSTRRFKQLGLCICAEILCVSDHWELLPDSAEVLKQISLWGTWPGKGMQVQ